MQLSMLYTAKFQGYVLILASLGMLPSWSWQYISVCRVSAVSLLAKEGFLRPVFLTQHPARK